MPCKALCIAYEHNIDGHGIFYADMIHKRLPETEVNFYLPHTASKRKTGTHNQAMLVDNINSGRFLQLLSLGVLATSIAKRCVKSKGILFF